MRKKSHCLSHRAFTFPWLSLPGVAIIKRFLFLPQLFHSSSWFSLKQFPTVCFLLSFCSRCLSAYLRAMDASLHQTRSRSVCWEGLPGHKKERQERNEGVSSHPFRSVITGLVTPVSPAVPTSPKNTAAPRHIGPAMPSSWEDDLLKLSVCSLATRMAAPEAVGVFGGRVGWMFWITALSLLISQGKVVSL